MKRGCALSAGTLVALCASAALLPVAGEGAGRTRSCGSIAFQPNTDYGAFRVRATGTTCRTARRVARRSRDLDVVNGPFRYRAYDFACRGTPRDDPLPSVRWRCVRGTAVVTFDRS